MAFLERKRVDSGRSNNISFASAQVPSTLDEDRLHCTLEHPSVMNTQMSSFGVFDGHAGIFLYLDFSSIFNYHSIGSFAATTLSKLLHDSVVDKYSKQLRVKSVTKDQLNDPLQKNLEYLFTEAIRLSFQEMDFQIKLNSDSGSTSVSIFLVAKEDGSVKVFCPWVGDSRCVLYYVTPDHRMTSVIMSQDHKPTLKREVSRIENKAKPLWRALPIEVNEHSFRNDQYPGEFSRVYIFINIQIYLNYFLHI